MTTTLVNKKANGGSVQEPPYDLSNPPAEIHEQRLKNVLRHIQHVQQSCVLLGERLMAVNSNVGHKLTANAFIHDNSKFYGIEWLYLNDDARIYEPDLFTAAWVQHASTNAHHPEFWDGIKNMPRLYLAEMVCDWHARSIEFGTDLRSYFKDVATKRFEFTPQQRVYRDIKELVDLLLDPPFT